MKLERLLTTSEVADILHICEKTVRKLKSQGLVPIRFGGKFRYRPEDVIRFMESRVEEKKEIYSFQKGEPIILFPGLSEEAQKEIRRRSFANVLDYQTK